MKHRPQLPDDSVNVTPGHPLAEALRLALAVAAIALALFFISGWLVDVVVDRLPHSSDDNAQSQIIAGITNEFGANLDSPAAQKARAIFQRLLAESGNADRGYRLLILDNDTVNALAAPGGVIIIFRGLLDEVESDNELAMILGHEIGHLHGKDHLRMAGRGILVSAAAALVFGKTDALSAHMLSAPADLLSLRYGRGRELKADRFGLAALCAVYGHRGGSADFFARHLDDLQPPEFFSTHPNSADRIDRLGQTGDTLDCMPGTPDAF